MKPYLIPLLMFVVLAACTAAPEAAPTAVPDPTAISEQPSAAAEVAVEEKATAAPAADSTIEVGRTAEGTFYRGNPNAPVIFTDYSNFF